MQLSLQIQSTNQPVRKLQYWESEKAVQLPKNGVETKRQQAPLILDQQCTEDKRFKPNQNWNFK